MTNLADLLARVEKLEARAEIGELVSAYAIACDDHDMPRLMSLFTDDAVLETPSGLMHAEGKPAIDALFVQTFKIRGPAFHWTHDHFVRFDLGPDEASGLVLAHAETSPNQEVSLAAMRYEDVYRKVGRRWLFARRRINFLYYVPAKDFPQSLTSATRITVSGRSLPADYPEQTAPWQAFDAAHNVTERK